MRESTRTILAVVFLVVVAGAFWMLLLSPQRDKANELSEQTSALTAEVVAEHQRADEALAAKAKFPKDYAQLVQLGTAVPSEAATSSLLVQLEGLGDGSGTQFQAIALGGSEGGAGAATGETEESTEPKDLPPLGSSAGAAGLAAMPYGLQFSGRFFDIANFIHGLDSMVKTTKGHVDAKGRLVTVDNFTIAPASAEGAPEAGPTGELEAAFNVTTYVTPPGQGITAGATPAGPAGTTPDLP